MVRLMGSRLSHLSWSENLRRFCRMISRGAAALLLQIVQGYNALDDGTMAPMPYLLGLHQLADTRFHLHVEILAIGRAPGKLKYAASSESLWGLWTNDSSPVQKAQELREAIVRLSNK